MKRLFTPLGIDHLVIACKDAVLRSYQLLRLGFHRVYAAKEDIDHDAYFGTALQCGGTRVFLVDQATKRFTKSRVLEFIRAHGDMQVMEVSIRVDSIRRAAGELMEWFESPQLTTRNYHKDTFGDCTTFEFTFSYRQAFQYTFIQRKEKFIPGVDHIAIAVDQLDLYVQLYRYFGFHVIYAPKKRNGLVQGKRSAMRTYALGRGGWTVALVEGVDQKDESQITTQIKAHGNHSVNHAALLTSNLEKTVTSQLASGIHFRISRIPLPGEIVKAQHIVHKSKDAGGSFLQCFTKPFARAHGKGGFFFELIERLPHEHAGTQEQAFDDRTVLGLYESIESEIQVNDKNLIISSSD